MIEDDEDDYEGYFLRPANEYNIKEKIIQANQESFAIPTPPSPRHHANGERRVTFREQLVDYEPDDYSSEDDGYGGTGGGGSGQGRRRHATIETVADVHQAGDVDGVDGADTIIEELHLHDRGQGGDVVHEEQDEEEEEEVIEDEQLEGDYEDEITGDRMEKHKTGVERESVVSEEEEEDDEERLVREEDGEADIVDEEEEEPTDGSSVDTEIHHPESSEDISSSPLKTYRSEADSRSGSGDSQGEDGVDGDDGKDDRQETNYDDDEYDGDHGEADGPDGATGTANDDEDADHGQDGDDQDDSDAERPIEAHRAKRSANCRRKCCRHKKSTSEKLPYYNGYRSEYGLSREELEEKKRRLEARRQRVRERQQRRTAEQRQKAQSNEEAFAAWLHGKLRNSINKHQNMYDVRQSSSGKQQQQQQNSKNRRRNAIHQISYG
ncbi:high mobility group nucleosome-binding domain-containing protein 5-like [Anopheles ziemanni]|uniref:high mobility group nucleosome-binding domain-containing protein 5 n=1 Tax=Anopheles coustani TaxID=139045 RepID=UPI002659760F|nr:high mobility group nucleosome-binding domain-containing protein 5 [Anopheles coustani]XP_058167318.1 high mobility group nucleosome-binding domain-containing protein 5-like [Anopheles ziemanni]